MLNFGRLSHLVRAIGVDQRHIDEVLDDFDTNPDAIVHELTLWPSDPTKKSRDVISIRGKWRLIQTQLYRRVFLPKFAPSPVSHGGVRGRSPLTNARSHIGNSHAYVTDVCGFFPSISTRRVNQFFLDHACSYEVARTLTRLCTYDHHLALGLITSPILANELFKPIDRRIAHACRKRDLTYTRFVDDLTISGKYDLKPTTIHDVVADIVRRHGFKLSEAKTGWGRLDDGIAITGVRVKRHHIDATKDYVAELERLIADHASLASDGPFMGPLLSEGELFGKSHFVCGLNPGRRRSILGKLRAINWPDLMSHALERQLIHRRKSLVPRGSERPEEADQLHRLKVASKHSETFKSTDPDWSPAPF
jgi:hypothetical protein